MFPARFFAARFFAPRFFPEVGADPIPSPPSLSVAATASGIALGCGFD